MTPRRKPTIAYLPETLTLIADANASAAATLRRKHPYDARLLHAADVMDEWAARYRRWAEAETPRAAKTGATP